MPASLAQIAANRANAQHSTGPRAAEGKATSARNALSHGSHASDDTILNAPNSPAASYLADFTAELAPSGPLETILVRGLALFAARTDLLDQALDAFPRLNQRRALVDYLQDQYDVRGPSADLADQPNWDAALRRYDGCDATYRRDPDPATDPDPAACTLAYSLTSPRYARLLRQHAQAGRGFHDALHDLQRLRAAHPRTAPSHPGAPAHLHAISDLLDRGWQLTPRDGPPSTTPNEPNPLPATAHVHLAHAMAQYEANVASYPTTDGGNAVRTRSQNEANPAPAPSWISPAGVGAAPAAVIAKSENEANAAPIPSAVDLPAPALDRALPQPDLDAPAPVLADLAPSGTHPPDQPLTAGSDQPPSLPASTSTAPCPPFTPSADLALLERLTRHAEQAISETAWRAAACHSVAGRRSVEDEMASLRALAKKAPARHAAIRVRPRALP